MLLLLIDNKMGLLNIIGALDFSASSDREEKPGTKILFNGERRQIIEISLQGSGVLKEHRVGDPITVLCIAGRGTFQAGDDLSEMAALEPGILLTLEPNILHEVRAETYLKFLLTRFKK
ncbi:MAG: hypothetical protein R2681_08200 [Pyrinomonadaceae bacterium]